MKSIIFESEDHVRYQDSIHISGPHGGAKRIIEIKPNISGEEGHSVTIYNGDGLHPIWQNNVQMATKQMKVISQNSDKIVLRGFGRDSYGASFSDYGISIFPNSQGEIIKITLHMFDRNIDIEYWKSISDFNKQCL